jgi:hypothetical protein
MRTAGTAIPLCLVVALMPGLLGGVSVESKKTFDFSGLTTYVWKEGTPARRPTIQTRITEAVDRELQRAGLKRVDAEADLYVIAHVLVDRHTLEELADSTNWKFWTGITTADPRDLEAGTLVIDLLDAASENIVWRGLASATVTGKAEKIERKIDRALAKMFKKFPPRKHGE